MKVNEYHQFHRFICSLKYIIFVSFILYSYFSVAACKGWLKKSYLIGFSMCVPVSAEGIFYIMYSSCEVPEINTWNKHSKSTLIFYLFFALPLLVGTHSIEMENFRSLMNWQPSMSNFLVHAWCTIQKTSFR